MNQENICEFSQNVIRNIYSYNNKNEPCEVDLNYLSSFILHKFEDILHEYIWYIFILFATNVGSLVLMLVIFIFVFYKKSSNIAPPVDPPSQILDPVQQMVKNYNDTWKIDEMEYYKSLLKPKICNYNK